MTVAKDGYDQGKKDAEALLTKYKPRLMLGVAKLQNQLADVMVEKYDKHGSTWNLNYVKGASETFLLYVKATHPRPILSVEIKNIRGYPLNSSLEPPKDMKIGIFLKEKAGKK